MPTRGALAATVTAAGGPACTAGACTPPVSLQVGDPLLPVLHAKVPSRPLARMLGGCLQPVLLLDCLMARSRTSQDRLHPWDRFRDTKHPLAFKYIPFHCHSNLSLRARPRRRCISQDLKRQYRSLASSHPQCLVTHLRILSLSHSRVSFLNTWSSSQTTASPKRNSSHLVSSTCILSSRQVVLHFRASRNKLCMLSLSLHHL